MWHRPGIMLVVCKVHRKRVGENISPWASRKRFNQINNQHHLLGAMWNRLHICRVERYKRFSIPLFYTHEIFRYSNWLNQACPHFTPWRCFSIYSWLNVNFICLAGVTKCFKCLFTLMSKYMLDLVTSYWFKKMRCGRQPPLRESETSRIMNISINVPYQKSLSSFKQLFSITSACSRGWKQIRCVAWQWNWIKVDIVPRWSSGNHPVSSIFNSPQLKSPYFVWGVFALSR